jgi:hypothetical protein
MLTPLDRSEAIAVMDRLMKHPITLSFHEPISYTEPPDPSISPIGLSTVRDRLRSGKYRAIHDWVTDVETVVGNYESCSVNIWERAAAMQVRRVFLKERAKMSTSNARIWVGSVTALRTRLSKLGHNAPWKVSRRMLQLCRVEIPKQLSLPLSQHEIHETLNGTEILTTEELRGLSRMIAGPQGDGRGVRPTPGLINEFNAAKIRDYVTRCVSRRGQ